MGKGFNELPKKIQENVRRLVEKPEGYPYNIVGYADKYIKEYPGNTGNFGVLFALRFLEKTELDKKQAQNTGEVQRANDSLEESRKLNPEVYREAEEYRSKVAGEQFLIDFNSGDEEALKATNPIDTEEVRRRIADAYKLED